VDSNLYNYFSGSAKRAIFRASEICAQFSNQFVEPEHIFFSILQLRSCSAFQVLQRLNINLPKLTFSLEAALYERAGDFKGEPQFSARALALLDASFREVKKLDHREIGTTHLLMALAQERSIILRDLFEEHGLDGKRVRDAFLTHQRGYDGDDKSQSATHPSPLWPPLVNQTIEVGKVPFTPSRALSKEALSHLVAAAQLARVFRQPSITPVELAAALLISSAAPQWQLEIMLELDSVALLGQISAYWQNKACQRDCAQPELLLSPELADLLGRAVARMLKDIPGSRHEYSISSQQLLLELLKEPSEPLRGWLTQQRQDSPDFASAVERWEARHRAAAAQDETAPDDATDSGADA
jgi:ATP-dependent Clp protease ATP-binding subunit ClpA